MAQMLVLPGEQERNLSHALRAIHRAADGGAQIVLLPEALNLGWTHPSALQDAEPVPNGQAFQSFHSAAQKRGVYVCAGLVERAGDNLFNSAVLISPGGELLLHHRKINELDFARSLYSLGDRLGVAETAFGRVGLMICADAVIDGQVISRTLGAMGAKCILSPCAWAVLPDHDNTREPYGQLWLDNYIPVCQRFGLWIFGCSNVGPITAGPWEGRHCIGSSLAINPAGEVVAKGAYGVEADEIVFISLP